METLESFLETTSPRRCWPGFMCVTVQKAATTTPPLQLWFLPAENVPAHVHMTPSNLGAIPCVRHGDRFDVCLRSPAIWELV